MFDFRTGQGFVFKMGPSGLGYYADFRALEWAALMAGREDTLLDEYHREITGRPYFAEIRYD